jgi:putative methyltransferase (TIGR04325 family)
MNPKLRHFLLRVLPPSAADAARRVRRRLSGEISIAEWEVVPASDTIWSTPVGWNHSSIVETQIKRWPELLESIEAPRPFGLWREEIMTFGYVLGRAAVNRSRLSVLDWGGGLGRHFLYARELHPEISLEYTIKDLPGLCAAGRTLLPEVSFITEEEVVLNRKYDLVLSASSLQYAHSPYELLDKLCTSTGRWFMILRTPYVEKHDDFVVVQRPHRHGYRTEYPGWFINRGRFIARVESHGLLLQREFPSGFDIFVPNAAEQCTMSGFLFKRS